MLNLTKAVNAVRPRPRSNKLEPPSGTEPPEAPELEFQLKVEPAVVNVATHVPVLKSAGMPSLMMPVPESLTESVWRSLSISDDRVKVKPPTDHNGLVAGTGNPGGLISSGLYMFTEMPAPMPANEPLAPRLTTVGPNTTLCAEI